MARIKAVIFDFIGTLAELTWYSLENSIDKLFRSLVANGYNTNCESFFKAYKEAHDKYREIRYGQLVEVTNAVWVSEALNHLGYTTTPQDERIKTAVNVFFEDYVHALKLRPSTKLTLQKLYKNYKLGLVSNFTYAPVIYAALRKLKINGFFNAVIVSEAVGWRKPDPKIFQEALERLHVESDEAFYVGDTPLEDIQGATNVSMKTVFIPSQFNSLSDMQKAAQPPDYTVENLGDIVEILNMQQL
ncbi:MAG: HAD family hydrolase [Candidatus Bathyarchaeota archaeon]|nr:HAD family hydrolase [Candidatus Bathyarchaeota archaeon]MDH5495703.1 HAD family hydrolase [Candidatus Bathyarchaeota archaeon]